MLKTYALSQEIIRHLLKERMSFNARINSRKMFKVFAICPKCDTDMTRTLYGLECRNGHTFFENDEVDFIRILT